MKSDQSCCLRGRHYGRTVDKNIFDKENSKLKNSLKISEENVVFAVVMNLKLLLSRRQEQ